MKIEYSGRDAVATMRTNPNRGWQVGSDEVSAKGRLSSGDFLEIAHKPKFHIDPSWPIFTMGSCFAREIEIALRRLKYDIVLEGHGVERQYYQNWNAEAEEGTGLGKHKLTRGAFNKYTVHSMSHEIRTALLGNSYENEGLIQLNKDTWFDPHAAGVKNLDFETTLKNRKIIEAGTKQIKRSKVVFLTLGLTETWVDNETGLTMNTHPGADWLVRLKDRWCFVDYGFQDALNELEDMISIIREYCDPEMKFVITVSPVPLGATFKNLDVIVASSGSKSILRAVADELYRKYEYVDYYPSYEMVVNSPRHLAFQGDQLHVADDMVKRVMSNFVASYTPTRG